MELRREKEGEKGRRGEGNSRGKVMKEGRQEKGSEEKGNQGKDVEKESEGKFKEKNE